MTLVSWINSLLTRLLNGCRLALTQKRNVNDNTLLHLMPVTMLYVFFVICSDHVPVFSETKQK